MPETEPGRARRRLALAAGLLVALAGGGRAAVPAAERPRLIVVTDIGTEPDDLESMVRLLTYSNEIDIEGLIAATSRHMSGAVHPELIERRVDAYGKVLANLRAHDPAYPDVALLRSRIRAWKPALGMAGVGAGKDDATSQLIVEAVDKADRRPVWVSIWGGAAPLAQALWTVRATRSPAAVERFVAKLRVYSISDQDDAGPWARATFPKLFWIASIHGPTQYELATWTGISADIAGADPAPVSRAWLRQNIQGRGVLGATYPLPMFIMEGDTPSFLNLIGNGLSVPDHPDWGGWGGRWERVSPDFGLWSDTQDSVPGIDGKTYRTNKATIWRWRTAFQNDFAARMAWSTTPRYAEANHPPRLVLNGAAGPAPVTVAACPGQPVALSTAGSADPDGQPLSYRWWVYREATGLYAPTVKLERAEGPDTVATVPAWTQPAKVALPPTYRLHLILEATDAGTPRLTRYRRAIIEVPTDGRVAGGKACARIVQAPPPEGLGFDDGPQAGAARFSTASDIGALLDEPRAKAVLQRMLPELVAGASIAQVRNMSIRQLRTFMPNLTAEKLAAIDAALKAVDAGPAR